MHGDLKPENILIESDDNDGYVAKVTDFGYSTLFAKETDLIYLPRSEPWTAPEQHYRGFLPAQAKKMDAYSFGMVCLWLLFYNTRMDGQREFDQELKNADAKVLDLALERLHAMQNLETRDRSDIEHLFRITLQDTPQSRTSDFKIIIKLTLPK